MTTETANSKSNKSSGKSFEGFTSLMSILAIVISLIAGVLIYKFIFGDPANFAEGDNTGEPLDGNLLATIYKGGFIVPILVAVNLIVIIFSIERFVTLSIAKGKGKSNKFVSKIKELLGSKEVVSAIAECDKQRGSLANVVRAGLVKYEAVCDDKEMSKEEKVDILKKELEEATSLELPMLSKNLVVLSTLASVSTLIGLIGTVIGMIRSFSAMSQGTPDTAQLATGISEALINTFLGIAGSTIAIIMYNFFSTKIDTMTYSIDEASFTIVQEFSASQK
jgi:biopolymer transport protein ExbB